MSELQQNIVIILGFLGEWFLFSFPLLQGSLELSEQTDVIGHYKESAGQYPKVSPWYWLLPPLKVYLERERVKKMLKSGSFSGVDKRQLRIFSMRATAWFYVAMAGAFNGIGKTKEVLEHFHWSESAWVFWSINGVMLILGIANVIIRLRISKQKLAKSKSESLL